MRELGSWLPDKGFANNPGLFDVINAVPRNSTAWVPYLPLEPIATPVLPEIPPKGVGGFRDAAGTSYIFVGTDTKLYRADLSGWIDHTRLVGGDYNTSGESWEFAYFGDEVFATNYLDEPQFIQLGTANFADLLPDVKFRHVAVVNNFLMGGFINDANGIRQQGVRWSAFGDPHDWAPSATTQSSSRDLEGDGGAIQKVLGGERGGAILQERATWRVTYVGAPRIFQFDEVEPGIGTSAPNSVVHDGSDVYYLAQDGFRVLRNYSRSYPIGEDQIDESFFRDLKADGLKRVIGGIDPQSRFIYWIYPGAGSSRNRPNRVLIYNIERGRWGRALDDAWWIFPASGGVPTALGLDETDASVNPYYDMDANAVNMDSRSRQGQGWAIGAINDEGRVSAFSATPTQAVFELGETYMFDPYRSGHLKGVRAVVDSAVFDRSNVLPLDLKMQVWVRDRKADPFIDLGERTPGVTGMMDYHYGARYISSRLTVTGDFGKAFGLDWEIGPGSKR